MEKEDKMKKIPNILLVILIIIFGAVTSINNWLIYKNAEEMAITAITNSAVAELSLCLNSQPVLTGICDDTIIKVDDSFFCDANASDLDNQNLEFFLNTTLIDINSNTGIIDFTANESQAGIHNINLSVGDNSSCANNVSSSLFTLIIADINITAPGHEDVIRPGEKIPFDMSVVGAGFITNVSVDVFNETFIAESFSSSLYNFTYNVINIPPKLVNAIAYAYNETRGPEFNVTDQIQLRIARPAGETSSPTINFTCSNETYALNKTNISIITTFDLDTLLEQSNASVLLPNNSIQFPMQAINSSDDATYFHSINYTYLTSNLAGYHTITTFVKDIENQTIELNAALHVSNVSKQVNITIINTEMPKIKDVCTGNVVFDTMSFILPNISYYDVEIDYKSIVRAFFPNSSFPSTVNATFNFTQLTNETDAPPGQRRIDMFDLLANIQYNNFNLTYNYSSVEHTLLSESSLDIYSCNATSCNSLTWDNLDVNVSTDANIITIAGLKNISRRYIVTEPTELPSAPEILNLTVAVGYIANNTLQNISLIFNVSGTLSSVTLTVDGSTATANKTATVVKTNYYNYTYKPLSEKSYTVTATVIDTNNKKANKSIEFFSAPEETFNLSMVGTSNITLRDIITGKVIASAEKINHTLPRGRYDTETMTDDGDNIGKTSITIVNATINKSVGIGLIYNDIGEVLTAPANTTNLDQFEVNSTLSFAETQFVYNYTSVNSSITHADNLEAHKCGSVSNCTFSELASTVNTAKNTIAFTSNNLSVFNIVESTKVEKETTIVTDEVTTTISVSVPGPSGGGSVITKTASLDLIAPSPISLDLNDSVILPLILRNTGQVKLEDISLTYDVNASGILVDIENEYFRELETGGTVSTDMMIYTSLEDHGDYEIIVNATAIPSKAIGEPKVRITKKIIINTIDVALPNRTIVKTRIVFAKDLFNENPECLELQELLDQADNALERYEYRKARALTESAINACRDLIASIEKYIAVPKPLTLKEIMVRISSVLAVIVVIILIVYRMISRPKLKRKEPRVYKEKKPGIFKFGFKFAKKKPVKREETSDAKARKEIESLLRKGP